MSPRHPSPIIRTISLSQQIAIYHASLEKEVAAANYAGVIRVATFLAALTARAAA